MPRPAQGRERERMDAVEALTFDTVVGTVCCCPSWAAVSPADIPPAGSPKQGQRRCSERDYSQSPTDGPTLYRQGLGELCQAGHCPPSLGRPRGPWAGALGSFTSKIES